MTFPHEHGNGRPSYWLETEPPEDRPALAKDERADVCVVGAGIVGLTTAYLLASAGRSVVVLDRERYASSETGHTTAHLQIAIDTRLATLVERFGREKVKLAWESQLEAVRTIEDIARTESIRCDLERLDAFLFTPHEREVQALELEAKLARDLGFAASLARPEDVPFPARGVLRFPDQGRFHVTKYLAGLVRALEAKGGRIYSGSEVVKVESGRPLSVRTRDGARVKAEWLVSATNVPWQSRLRMWSRLSPYRTYVVGARVPRGAFRDALYWDTRDPYHYARLASSEDSDLVILGGEDHPVGAKTDTGSAYADLEGFLREATPEFTTEYRWSGEVIETDDDLPYIGRAPGQGPNELLATGDSGTGMTNGTIAAVMLSERILGRGTPWDDLYDPSRAPVEKQSVADKIKDNVSMATHVAKDWLLKPERASAIASLAPGDGIVVRDGVRPVAVSRDERGEYRSVSATCTHLGCTVAWNRSEGSWDCPCHGSRFAPSGEVLHGPAVEPLEPVRDPRLREAESARRKR